MSSHKRNLTIPEAVVPTLNKMGYMTSEADICIEKFVKFSRKAKHPVLDIGAAYGVATHLALEAGAQVVAVDLKQEHLDILRDNTPDTLRCNLQTIKGRVPDTVQFAQNTFDAILVSRVLHFLDPEQIIKTMGLIENWLCVGGRVFVSVATPFSQLYEEFIPIFLERKKTGCEWPGTIENTRKLKHEKMKNFPQFLNLFDKEVLEGLFSQSNLVIKECGYLSRENIPEDMRLDSREGVYLIAEKKGS